MIWLLIGILVVGCVVSAVIITKKNCWDEKASGFWLALLIVMVIPSLIFTPLYALANGRGLMQWQAFYEANSRNYEIAVDETASYLSSDQFIEDALIPIDGSIERFKLTESVSLRIVEWRNAVNRYNSTIASMKYYNRNIFTGVLVPDEVEDMKLLIIK